MFTRILLFGTVLGLGVTLTGCATSPTDNPKVDEARSSYQSISDDPDVARSGAEQLRNARNDLNKAEKLLKDGASQEQVEHYAYLAQRHTEIAKQQGLRASLQDQIESADQRRQKLQLQIQSRQASQAKMEAQALRAQMEALQAKKTERGMVLTLGDVLFDLNKAELKPAGKRTVRKLADFMKKYPERRVRIEGYTDSTGKADYNQTLSEHRADAVLQELIGQGIDPNRMETKGFGEQYPVASNDTDGGRQRNRRVEIVISDENGEIKTRDE